MIKVAGITSFLDQPWKWADSSTWRRPLFNVKAFQKKIDAIVGKSLRGDSIVKLRFMRDSECYEQRHTSWDSFGKPITSELRARYKFITVGPLEDGTIVDIPPPRWVLEQRYEPEQIRDAWEKERWQMNNGLPVPVKDACPDGYYTWLWTIATHHNCCENGITINNAGEEAVCWGFYRHPGEKDLTTLKAMMWRRAQDDVMINPFERPSHDMELKTVQRQFDADKVEQDKKDELGREIIGDAIRQNLHKFTDDPGILKHGKYHFTSKGSGLPANNDKDTHRRVKNGKTGIAETG